MKPYSLKCLEKFESPGKKVFHQVNPMIKLDLVNKKNPYFCCESHEEEFQTEFQSDEEFIGFCDSFEGIVFLNEPQDVEWMKFKDEVGVQCSEGTPISLQDLSVTGIKNEDLKVLIPKKVGFYMSHDPLIILPRTSTSPCLNDSDDDGSFQCKFCFKIFLTGQALGGHMSRKHPTKPV